MDEGGESAIWDVFDVGSAGIELVDFGLLDVYANDVETSFGKFNGEGKTDVAETKDAYAGFLGFYFVLQIRGDGRNI